MPSNHPLSMKNGTTQSLTPKSNLQGGTYLVLAALSCFSLISIAILLIPQAVKTQRYNRCVDVQIDLRAAINPQGLRSPGKMNYLKAVEHCEGL